MENEKLIPLTDAEMLALLASSTLVYTAAPEVRLAAPEGTVTTTSYPLYN
jgi:hypothetical protein